MNEKNNFKQINGFGPPPKEVKGNVKSHLDSLRFIGSLVDLYVIKSAAVILKHDSTPQSEQFKNDNNSLTK